MKATKLKNDLVSAAKVGRQTGLSRHTILRRAKQGLIPSYRFGRNLIRFDPDEAVEALLATGQQQQEAGPEGDPTVIAVDQ
ncbi:MAG: helix-turn-helix domain-containing protein [Myxococcales bacterium]|nr:helix-turn-helix domain-containing protein [Myxococcales bacterium]